MTTGARLGRAVQQRTPAVGEEIVKLVYNVNDNNKGRRRGEGIVEEGRVCVCVCAPCSGSCGWWD